MSLNWNFPRTEEGVAQTVLQLEDCKRNNNLIEVGNGLIALSFLAKWVRPDAFPADFKGVQETILEAIDIFRAQVYPRGLIRALVSASATALPNDRQKMMEEAETLADKLGDDALTASVLAARGRFLASTDRAAAKEIHLKVLDVFRRLKDLNGLARTQFSLAISEGTNVEKRNYALAAAESFRAIGNPTEASRCMAVALWNTDEDQSPAEVEVIARQGLSDAVIGDSQTQIKMSCQKLSEILFASGNLAEAKELHERADEIGRAEEQKRLDTRTPLQRWNDEVETTKEMIVIEQAMGHQEIVDKWKEELKRLEGSKPIDFG